MIAQTVKQRNDVLIAKVAIIHRFLALVQPGYSKRRSRPSKLRIKFRIRRLGVLYRHARQFLEKAMRRRPEKHIHINGHSSRREYGSNICDSRNYDTEECCRGYT
ncbi:hypothetical protein TNCV_4689601 [Trichonephila clavipes]|nr:hypothetical protein TNCV_4689601 [Trichonephila clavipes]